MTLIQHYSQNKETLRAQLKRAKTPKESIEIIQEYLSKLTDLNGDYISGLTRSQARIALDVLGLFQYTIEKVASSMDHPIIPPLQPPTTRRAEQPGSVASFKPSSETLVGIGAASLIGGVLTGPLIAVTLALTAGFGAAVVTHGFTREPKGMSNSHTEPSSPSQSLEDSFPDYDLAFGFLEELFKTVDTMVEEYGRLEESARPRPVEPKLDDHRGVLEFIQDLLGWYERKQGDIPKDALQPLKMRLKDHLPDLLSEYDIQIKYYDPETTLQDAAYFDFEKEVGAQKLQSPLMVRPALLKGAELLLKGRVIEPTTSTAHSHQAAQGERG